MPKKDGVETIREIKSLRAEGKIIAITGGGTMRAEGRLNLAKNMGADDVLAKPFSDEDLMACVNACLFDVQLG